MGKHISVTTNEQVGYQRHWAMKIIEAENKWKKHYSWYPEEQRKHYAHYERIYKESIAQYGEEEFKKYAQIHRLNRKFTDKVGGPERQSYAYLSTYPMNYMENVKLSATENGTYGMIPPGYHHFC